MEKMRLTQWGDGATAGTGTTGVSAYPTTATVVPITLGSGSSGSGLDATAGDIGSKMHLTRTATDVHTGMIKVTLVITWTTFDGRTMSRSYITYYGKNGLYDGFIS